MPGVPWLWADNDLSSISHPKVIGREAATQLCVARSFELDAWLDYPLWLTFCEGISYNADCDAVAQSTCPRSLGRSDQAAGRKPAGTESQVEPTTGAQSR